MAVIASCLPDLAPVAPVAPLCGNGIIDDDAGEKCDPGDGAVGCSSTCLINCGDGGFIDPSTNHCYFLLSSSQASNSSAINTKSGCPSPEAGVAHVVTFVSDNERKTVTGAPLSITGLVDRYWVGLHFYTMVDGGPREWVSENPVEPGWAGDASCPGCYANVPPSADGFRGLDEAGTAEECVVALKNNPAASWSGMSCLEFSHVICEREPPGSRAQPCNGGDWCIQLKATYGTKSYEYHPDQVGPTVAERTCKSPDAGTAGKLVVFETPEEREQLLHELLNLPGGTAAPSQFWIGLSRAEGTDAATPWTWDDQQPLTAYPLPWGIGAPETPGGVRAYVNQDGISPDTQLAHASTLTQAPFVCQY